MLGMFVVVYAQELFRVVERVDSRLTAHRSSTFQITGPRHHDDVLLLGPREGSVLDNVGPWVEAESLHCR